MSEFEFAGGQAKATSFGASNPIVGVIASQILQDINRGGAGLAHTAGTEVAAQSVSTQAPAPKGTGRG